MQVRIFATKFNFRAIMEKMRFICAFVIGVSICACSETKKKSSELQNVYNLIIIDESGSMGSIEEEAVNGLNETFQTIAAAQKEHTQQRHFVSLVTFNSLRIHNVYDRKPIGEDCLEWEDYYPQACTPLFDAMGSAIDSLRKYVTTDDIVLVTIITDGMENASRRYSGKQIKEMVSDLKSQGWVFAYIGTNQDVDSIADEIGVRNRMGYGYSSEGVRDMWKTDKESRMELYYSAARKGKSAIDGNYGYFRKRKHGVSKGETSTIKQKDK